MQVRTLQEREDAHDLGAGAYHEHTETPLVEASEDPPPRDDPCRGERRVETCALPEQMLPLVAYAQ
jgi:hypothetical protein